VKLFRLPGRFEWKILIALFIVALVPLGAAGFLMSVTIRRVQALTEQHQEAVRRSLGGAVEVYRSYFAEMKDTFRERAYEISQAPVQSATELADVPDLLHARLLVGTRLIDEWHAPAEVLEHAHEAPPNLVALAPPLPFRLPERRKHAAPAEPEENEPRLLELTFGISREIYANFLSLREATEKEHDLDRLLPLVLPKILRGLGASLIAVLAFATVLGLFVARRATGRVATLRDAAKRVGEGDLTVRVRPRGSDELDDLGRAFDRMVAELDDARSRLGYMQKLSAWQEVARRLAHEIKNPLTPIQLAVQELGSKYRGDDPTYQRLLATALDILNEEVGAIRRLVDDFSSFARLPKVAPAPVDLGQVVEDFARAHPEWQPALAVAPHEAVGALCDRMLIRRVLTNLVENAVQAAEGAGRTPEVRIEIAPADAATARITVDDNGPGVTADARERIFDPYVTTKEHGTGLGLAIVRKVVFEHGGDVRIADGPSPLGGARFVITLPSAGLSAPPGAPPADTDVPPG
jgi:two-component system nitrogen regulation sensor histidine kinase NtrY